MAVTADNLVQERAELEQCCILAFSTDRRVWHRFWPTFARSTLEVLQTRLRNTTLRETCLDAQLNLHPTVRRSCASSSIAYESVWQSTTKKKAPGVLCEL